MNLIFNSQGNDLLYIRLKKELVSQSQGSSNQKTTDYKGPRLQPSSGQEGSSQLKASYEGTGLKGYVLDKQGLLCYKGRVVVSQQKALIQELLYLYYNNQLVGHQDIDKTIELL